MAASVSFYVKAGFGFAYFLNITSGVCLLVPFIVDSPSTDLYLSLMQMHFTLKGITVLIIACVTKFVAFQLLPVLKQSVESDRKLLSSSDQNNSRLLAKIKITEDIEIHLSKLFSASLSQCVLFFIFPYIPYLQPLSSYIFPIQNTVAAFSCYSTLAVNNKNESRPSVSK